MENLKVTKVDSDTIYFDNGMKLLKSIIIGLLAFLAVYLTGVFANATFNINNWDESYRELSTGFGLIFFFTSTILSLNNFKN